MAARKTKTTKSKAKPARRKRALTVGSVVQVNGDESKSIKTSQGQIDNLRMALARLREEFVSTETKYKQTEAQLVAAIAKAREEQVATIKVAGEKHGIDLEDGSGKRWAFDTDAMTFTRQA